YVTRLTNAYENVSLQLKTKFNLLRNRSVTSFSPAAYIDAKAKAVITATSNQNIKKRIDKQKKEKKSKEGKVKEGKIKNSGDKEEKIKRPVGYSKRRSFDMFNEGKNVTEIAAERNLSPFTIAGHLGEFIASGELDILKVMDNDTYNKIDRAFDMSKDYSEARERLGESVDPLAISIYYSGIYKPRNGAAASGDK
ncbi:MAG: helix-turn-helix domain-containing protein, partial [Muribaculaceae bacterium]|nr:helix-turn-helix domain-containing protein [Muribaculaceae bacterium]